MKNVDSLNTAKIQMVIVSALMFLLPWGQSYMSLILVLLIVNVLASFFLKSSINPFPYKFTMWSLLFGIIYLLGATYTTNAKQAELDVIQKFSPALMAILLITPGLQNKNTFSFAKKAFIISCVLTLLACFVFAGIRYRETHDLNEFMYTRLAIFLHTAYFSMYLCLALVFILNDLANQLKTFKQKFILYIGIAIICTGIYLLASKSGIITMLSILIIYGIHNIYKRIKHKTGWIILSLTTVASVFVIAYLPTKSNRLHDMVSDYKAAHYESDENLGTTGQRILIWQAAFTVIQENFWLGTGVGNDNSALNNEFKKRGYNKLAKNNLNAHNQFIQSFIALGIIGFIFSICYFLMPVYMGIRNQNLVLFSFGIIIFMNAMTESIFNRQSGILFWAVWSVLLMHGEYQGMKKKNLVV